MKNIRIKKWVPIDDVEHIKTSWQISDTEDFTNILLNIEESDEFVNILLTNIEPLPGSYYYVRYKRHFDDDSSSSWSRPKAYTTEYESSTLLLAKDVVIDKPMVYVNADKLETDNIITIKTSKYRGEGDGHFSTHYVIENTEGEVLFCSLGNEVDKTEIVVNVEEYGLDNYNKLIIKAAHRSGAGIESEFGSVILSLYDFNYDILSDTKRVIPFLDYKLELKQIDTSIETNIVRIDVKDSITEKTILTFVPEDIGNIVISGSILEPRKEYFLDIYTTGGSKQEYLKRIKLVVVKSEQDNDVDINFTYEGKYDISYVDPSHQLVDSLTTMEMFNLIVPVVLKDSTKVNVANYATIDNKLLITDKTIQGISLLTSNNDGCYIYFTEDNKILIDTLNGDSKPTFMVYEYNPTTKVANLLHTLVREDETIPLGVTNAIITLVKDEFLYITPDNGIIKKYNIVSNVVETILDSQIPNFNKGTLVYTGNNKLLILGGSEKDTYLYNISSNSIDKGLNLPLRYRDRGLKSLRLKNGDYIIQRIEHKDNEEETNYLYYDYKEQKFIDVERNVNDGFFPNTFITTITGDVLLCKTKDEEFKQYVYR